MWALALQVLCALVLALHQYPLLQPYAYLQWKVPIGGEAPPAPKVTFLGLSAVLVGYCKTELMTDGFFSRPGKLQTFLSQVEPDMRVITRGLQRAVFRGGVGHLAAVIYCHAMDAPEVSRLTGAPLLG